MSDALTPPKSRARKSARVPKVTAPAAEPQPAAPPALLGPDGVPLPPVPAPPPPAPGPMMEPSTFQPGVQHIGPPKVYDPVSDRHLTPVPEHMGTMVGGIGVPPDSRLLPLLSHRSAGPAGEAQAEMASLILVVEKFEEISTKLVTLTEAMLAKAEGPNQRYYAAAAVLAEVDPVGLADLASDVKMLLQEHVKILEGRI
jgi:hypothetical protein